MKLRHIKIQDFRGIDEFEWDFIDVFGEVQPVTVVVGPNGSGKSSILDAIWFGLMSVIGYQIQRIGFREEKYFVVRKGANYAKINYEIEIGDTEHAQIQEWKDTLVAREAMGNYQFPDASLAKLEWTYPAQPNYKDEYYQFGGYKFSSGYDWALLQGHNYYRKLDNINVERPSRSDMRGGVYLFEQERRFEDTSIQNIDRNLDETKDNENSSFNLRSQLVRLKDLEHYSNGSDTRYRLIQEGFNYICNPKEMRDITTIEGEFTIEFRTVTGTSYTFDGLSSGERSVLYILTRYVTMQARNAIVLIDELEMHLHPTWQRRLFESLQRFDHNNQFIITTHSPTVEIIAPDEATILLGNLDELPKWQLEMDYSDDA